jgi:Transposase DDE domain
MQRLDEIGRQMRDTPDQQISLTDPDARSMATSGRGTGIVGYNVQTAVDTKHHLIVAHEVTNVGHDRAHLSPMAKRSRDAIAEDTLTVLADRGYFSGEEIHECAQQGINALVPKPLTSGNRAQGLFDKKDFEYILEDDEYRCPAGQRAIRRFTSVQRGLTLHKYRSSACPRCPMKGRRGDARRANTGRSRAGSMSRSWRRCRHGWIAHLRPRGCAGRPWSTPSPRSRHGWDRLTS